jgi:hypothetical protein
MVSSDSLFVTVEPLLMFQLSLAFGLVLLCISVL